MEMTTPYKIKLRCWDKEKKVWVEKNEFGLSCEGEIQIYFHDRTWDDSRYVFTQSTTYKDKNGKEVWDGDIVIAPDFWYAPERGSSKYTVTWRGDHWALKESSLISHSSTWEVVGNCFENPDLADKEDGEKWFESYGELTT